MQIAEAACTRSLVMRLDCKRVSQPQACQNVEDRPSFGLLR